METRVREIIIIAHPNELITYRPDEEDDVLLGGPLDTGDNIYNIFTTGIIKNITLVLYKTMSR